jgi:hypothetical protein
MRQPPFADVRNYTSDTADKASSIGPNTEVWSWCFRSSPPELRVVGASKELAADFAVHPCLGHRVRYRMERKLRQEDMISYGFSVRHLQVIGAGRPSSLLTMPQFNLDCGGLLARPESRQSL